METIDSNNSKKSLKNAIVTTILRNSKEVKVYYVTIPMVKDHADIRIAKFKPLIKRYAKEFKVSQDLIYAIIKTESNFNQFAVSGAGAFGLMQVVPKCLDESGSAESWNVNLFE